MAHPDTRNTLYVEDAEVIAHNAHPEQQYHIQLRAPETAQHALPGSFIHLSCDKSLPMRRPMSIMRVNASTGLVDVLYKVHGEGTKLLAERKVGDTMSLIGPIGQPFKIKDYKKRPLLIGGGVGIPPMVFLAEHMKNRKEDVQPLVIMGSEIPFPFTAKPSSILVDTVPNDVTACMPLLDDWGIASRLTSLQDYAGCFQGYVTDLSRHHLDALSKEQRAEVEIFSCGPTPMLEAVAKVAAEYDLPCQVSLEEHMACAVGGCAGCTVLVQTDNGPAMKRVCVDGPVFEACSVFPQD